MNRYLFVINPVSGGIEKDLLIEEIHQFCKANSIRHKLYQTKGEKDCENISEVVELLKPQVMVVSGGDGTINALLPVVLKYKLVLGIIPAGSANGLATEFGITANNVFATLKHQHLQEMDVICVDDKYMVHLADFGLNAMMVKRYEQEERRGFLGYAISALKEMGSLEEPFKVVVNSNDSKREFTTKLLVIANAKKYGTGFQINPEGKMGDGRVELCILKELSVQLFIDQLVENELASSINNSFEILPVSDAELTFEKPIDFQSDGEYLGKKDRLKIQILDQKISVLVPV